MGDGANFLDVVGMGENGSVGLTLTVGVSIGDNEMPNTCPDCGADPMGDATCQSIFDSFLALEITDPEYGQVHMLTVACFLIQHNRYSDEALIWIEHNLRALLEGGLSTEQIRRQQAKEVDQNVRTWKVVRQPGAKPLPKIAWSMTVADVASNYHDAQSYCELIRQWVATTLREMHPLISTPREK
jgi:hypothetical protein